MIGALIGLLMLVLMMVVYQTITSSKVNSKTPHPIVEEEEHLYAERPEIPTPREKVGMHQKNVVISELMLNGRIDFKRAKELGIKRLPSVIFRLRKHHKIENVIVNGKFSHYELIQAKGL